MTAGPTRGTPPVPATSRIRPCAPRPRRRRRPPAARARLAACGYGSEAKDDTRRRTIAAGAKKIDGLDSVKIGYFGNLTHATALVGNQKGFFQKELGGTAGQVPGLQRRARPRSRRSTPAPSTSAGSAPRPSINGYTKSQRQEPAHHRRFGLRRREARGQPEEDQVPERRQGQEDRHPAARQHPGRRVPQLDRRARAGRSTRRAARATSPSSAPTTRSPRTPTSPAPSTAPGCRSRPRPSWSPRAARCCSTRATCGRTGSS